MQAERVRSLLQTVSFVALWGLALYSWSRSQSFLSDAVHSPALAVSSIRALPHSILSPTLHRRPC